MKLFAYSNHIKQNIQFEMPEYEYTCSAVATQRVIKLLNLDNSVLHFTNITVIRSLTELPKKHQKKELIKI